MRKNLNDSEGGREREGMCDCMCVVCERVRVCVWVRVSRTRFKKGREIKKKHH